MAGVMPRLVWILATVILAACADPTGSPESAGGESTGHVDGTAPSSTGSRGGTTTDGEATTASSTGDAETEGSSSGSDSGELSEITPVVTMYAHSGQSTTEIVVDSPATVFFDTAGTTAPSTDRPFHELAYAWDFGERIDATWERSGLQQRTAVGPFVAMVFEHGGDDGDETHEVTLDLYGPDGDSTTWTGTVVVRDPAETWPDDATWIVAPDGDFSGAPGHNPANESTTSDFGEVMALVRSGRRVLLARGFTYTASGPADWDQLGGGDPALLGAWGAGADPRIQCGSGGFSLIQNSAADVDDFRMVDLDLVGHASGNDIFDPDQPWANSTLLRLDISNHHKGLRLTHALSEKEFGTNGAFATTVTGSPSHSDFFVMLTGTRVAVVDVLSRWEGTDANSSSASRFPVVRGLYVHSSEFEGAGASNQAFRLHGKTPWQSEDDVTRHVVLTHNRFVGDSSTTHPWLATWGTHGDDEDARLQDIRAINNHYRLSATNQLAQIITSAVDVTIENNTFDVSDGHPSIARAVVLQHWGASETPEISGIAILNPTLISRGGPRDAELLMTAHGVAHAGKVVREVRVRNALSWVDAGGAASWWSDVHGDAVGIDVSHNLDASASEVTSVFVGADDGVQGPDDLRIVDSPEVQSDVVDQGSDGVGERSLLDHAGTLRGDGVDLGAFELLAE